MTGFNIMGWIEIAEILKSRWQPGIGGPMIVGIGGGSGSGKSSYADLLQDALRPLRTEVINLDRFFKPPAEMPSYYSTPHGENRPNFNHPESFRREEMIDYCRRFVSPETVDVDVVIVEGILALYFAELRSLMHLRCYIQVPLEQMLARRLQRNLAAGYGGTEAEIEWYNRECVSPEHQRFNAPTALHGDVLISNADGDGVERDRALADTCRAIRGARAP
ncbi:MAG: hypothetical protein ACRBK7_30055 [Acidimicrobiales bacterium]